MIQNRMTERNLLWLRKTVNDFCFTAYNLCREKITLITLRFHAQFFLCDWSVIKEENRRSVIAWRITELYYVWSISVVVANNRFLNSFHCAMKWSSFYYSPSLFSFGQKWWRMFIRQQSWGTDYYFLFRNFPRKISKYYCMRYFWC